MNQIKNVVRRIFIIFLFMSTASVNAQRVTQADIYGDNGGGGGFIGGIIGILFFGIPIAYGFITDKVFRLGIIAYIGVLVGFFLIAKEFGKEGALWAAGALMIVALMANEKMNRK